MADGPEPVWVTSRTPRGERLQEDAEEVELLPEYGRNPGGALRNVLSAAWVVARRRPRTVVTSGAGVVAPVCVLARLAGARLLYVETMARVSSPSMTARVLSRIAARVVVQWPELASALPRAEVCRPTLLENVADGEHPAGAGTFVAVGTTRSRTPGCFRWCRARSRKDCSRARSRPKWVRPYGIFPARRRRRRWHPAELEAAVGDATVVVCHGGAGIISSALAAGRRPIVVPRRAELGEHIDDHQQQLTGKLAEWGLVVAVEERITARDVDAAQRPLEVPGEIREHPSAADVLRDALVS